MLSITGDLLTTEDKRFIRYATIYTLDYLMPKIDRTDYNLSIEVSPKGDRDCNAECEPFPRAKKRKAAIWVNEIFVKDDFSTLFYRLDKQFFIYLFHELVHVKQYFTHELKDFTDGKYSYKGVIYDDLSEDLEGYYLAPYEMEARAYEDWLWVRFDNHVKASRGLTSGK